MYYNSSVVWNIVELLAPRVSYNSPWNLLKICLFYDIYLFNECLPYHHKSIQFAWNIKFCLLENGVNICITTVLFLDMS